MKQHSEFIFQDMLIHNDAIIPNSMVGSFPDSILSQTNATDFSGQLRFLAALSSSFIHDDFLSLFDLRLC